MRVAYLINQYPMVSLSFIRREIAALERQGIEVVRYAIRAWDGPLVDPADQQEQRKTRWILQSGAAGLFWATLTAALSNPAGFLRALRLVMRVASKSDRSLPWHMAYLMEACVLRAWSKADGVSHVHAHFASNPAEVAMLCHEMGGPPYSFTVHGPEEIDRAERLSLNLKIGRAKFVVAISQYCRSQLFRWCRHDDWHKIRIVHCGLDDSYLKRPVTPPGAGRRLVCVGRICEQKGQLILMDAAAALRRQGVDFEMVLVGDGELRREVEELIERHDLSDQVRITGWATTDEVQRELDACRAMILPSFAEGLPVVIMEALAMGRPVIATYIAGIPELVEPGINGWLCPAGSTDALLDAMRQALDGQPEQLESMGRRGAQAVAERHDVARESAKLIRLIQGDAV